MFPKFKLMNRFNSFSKYIRIHREEMGLKVFLPGDKKEPVIDSKEINVKPIVVTRNNAPMKIEIVLKKEQIRGVEIKK
jgi:hypothetical protein